MGHEALNTGFSQNFGLTVSFADDPMIKEVSSQKAFIELFLQRLHHYYEQREQEIGVETMRQLEKIVLLHTLDTLWKEHLYSIDQLKEGIGLRGYGQKDPLREYQREGYDMFIDLLARMKEDAVTQLCHIRVTRDEEVEELDRQTKKQTGMVLSRGEGIDESGKRQPVKNKGEKVGRNDPCPCGSGKKYKRCCGR